MYNFQIPTPQSFGYQHVKEHGEEGGGQVGEAGGMGDWHFWKKKKALRGLVGLHECLTKIWKKSDKILL